MPNWCEGNIRFRGKKQNIVNLILNEFEPTGNSEIKYENDEIYATDTGKKYKEDFYINGTNRCFVEEFHVYLGEDNEKEIVLCLDGFKAARNIKDQGFRELARKYQVDIKCVGFECGCEFYQIVSFDRSGAKKEEYKEYELDEWEWNCLFPNLGG